MCPQTCPFILDLCEMSVNIDVNVAFSYKILAKRYFLKSFHVSFTFLTNQEEPFSFNRPQTLVTKTFIICNITVLLFTFVAIEL